MYSLYKLNLCLGRMSVNFCGTTRRYIPEDNVLYIHAVRASNLAKIYVSTGISYGSDGGV
jgi:hypothetical protein